MISLTMLPVSWMITVASAATSNWLPNLGTGGYFKLQFTL